MNQVTDFLWSSVQFVGDIGFLVANILFIVGILWYFLFGGAFHVKYGTGKGVEVKLTLKNPFRFFRREQEVVKKRSMQSRKGQA